MAPVRLLVSGPGGEPVEFSSRVWDVEPTPDGGWLAVLVRPRMSNGAPVRIPGSADRAILEWTSSLGPIQAPVAVTAGVGRHGPVWAATQVGPIAKLQRREYFRVQLAASIRLVAGSVDEEDSERTLNGSVVDLGEGGTLAVVRGELPDPGTELATEIMLGSCVVRPDAVVVRVVDFPSGTRGLALRFVDPNQYGAPIRAALADFQRRHARASRATF